MHCTSFGSKVGAVIFGLLSLAFFGEAFLWIATNAPLAGKVPLGSLIWYAFSFGSGILSALLPFGLAFVLLIAPTIKRDGLLSGSSSIIALSAGLLVMLMLYGGVSALLGKQAIDLLPNSVSHLNDWILICAGIFVYTLALGEIGLIRMRISSYGSSAPKFIQKRGQLISFFLLGIFLGNIGVGSISPAIPLLLVKATASASVPFGVALFAIHGIGRILPLVIIALLFAYGMDGARWISRQSERILHINGWIMIASSSVILTLGVFSHNWFASSRLYDMLSSGSFSTTLLPLPVAPLGIFGLPVEFGGIFLILLLVVPFWWYYAKERRRVYGTPAREMERLAHDIDKLEASRRHLEIIAHIPNGEHGAHILRMEREIDARETKRRILEDAVRYGAKGGLRESGEQAFEEAILRLKLSLFVTLSLLLVVIVVIFLS